MLNKRRCYIAGPMRGRKNYNYAAFNAAARLLRGAGWYVYNPAEMDQVRDGGPPIGPITAAVCRKYAVRDLDVITKKLMSERDDAIVVLPGWARSTGALAEVGAGCWVQLKIISLEEALEGYYP